MRELNAVHNEMRKKDAVVLSFFGGMDLILFIFLIYFSVVDPKHSGDDHWNEIYSSIETFQFTLIIVFIMFATGFAIYIFRSFGVNYQFIFELDHNYKLIHHQIYGLGMILFSVWLACVTFQVARIKMSENDEAVWTLVLLLAFIFICTQPFHFFYRTARFQLAKTLL